VKTVILCGGKGTRLKEETEFKPKPMVNVGDKPILWHIMKLYAHYGHREFVLTLGYKGQVIKEFFLNERAYSSDFTLDTRTARIEYHEERGDDFKITFADTGLDSLTGERLLRVRDYLGDGEFMLTYGDGVADVDIADLIQFHRSQKALATITGVHPHSKYGLVRSDAQGRVEQFSQKPTLGDFVNGGFMVLSPGAFDYVDNGMIEDALIRMTVDRKLSIYHHKGFWKAMDTYQEMEELNRMWGAERPWAVWEGART
jgi:glucose-1-phosphate cytidylyltransferase